MKRKQAAPPSADKAPVRETILAVEDNPITLKLVQVTLQKEGYQVITAADGKTALALAAQQMPRLILQDLKLPDIDGVDLVRRLRALPDGENTPIIAFTGFVSKVEQGIIANVGFTDFLIKPVESSQLLAAVRTHLLPTQAPNEKPGRGWRLLLVDDDPTLLKYSRLQFTNAGFDVVTVRGGQEALEQARKKPPDIIVSDVLMPGMDGFQLCYAARQDPALRKVPVVLMSANYLEEADHKLAERIGASGYVMRSLGMKEMLNTVMDGLSRETPVPTIRTEEEFERERHARITWQLDRMVNLRAGAVQRSYTQAAILNELSLITETLTQRRDTDSALKAILAHCLDGAGLSKGLLYLTDDHNQLKLHVQYGCDKLLVPAQNLFGQPDLFAQLLRAEYPMQIPSPALPARAGEALLTQLESESALMIPLPMTHGGRGLLALFSTSLNLVEEDWVAFGRSLASQIGQTIALSQTIFKLVKSEQELRRYGEIVATTTDLLAFRDTDNRYVVVNDQYCKYLNLPREQIIGRTPAELILNEPFQQVVKRNAERCLQGEIVHDEHWQDYPSMGRRYMSLNYHPFRDASGQITGMVTVASDITGRKRQEDELRYINRALKAISACNAVVVRSVNEQTFLSEFCRILVQEVGFKMVWVGLAVRDEARTVKPVAQAGFGNGYLEQVRISWADNELGHGPVGMAIRTGKPDIVQNVHTNPDFVPWRAEAAKRGYASIAALPLTVSGEIYGALNLYAAEPDSFDAREIVLLTELANEFAHGIEFLHTRKEREKTQTALRESEALMRLFIEHSPAAIAMFDMNMRYLAVSRRWLSDYKLGEQNLIGRSHYEVFPEIPQRWREVHQRCLAGASEMCDEDRFDRADGSVQWERWEIHPWRRGDDKIGGILMFTVDVTERKRINDELQQRLDQQAAISHLGQFALVMRNPASVESEVVAILTHTLNVEYSKVLKKIPGRNALLLSAGHGWRKGLVGHAILEIEKNTQASYTLRSKTPVVVEDINQEKRFKTTPLFTEHAIVSGISIIIGDTASPLGILGVHSRKLRKFTDNDVHFLEAIAHILAESHMRYEQEQLLARTEQRFAHLINSSPSVIYATSRGEQHICNFVSDTIKDLIGIEPKEMQNDPDFWFDHVHPHDRLRVITEIGVAEDRGGGTVEYRFQCSDGEYRWIRDNFRVVGKEIIGSWTDLTASHEAEQKVLDSQKMLSGIIDFHVNAVITIGEDHRIIIFNPAAEDIFRCKADQVIGQDIHCFIPERFRAAHRDHLRRFVVSGESKRRMGGKAVLLGLRADGEEFPIEASISRLEIGGKVLLTVVLADITEKVKSDAARRESEERFRTVAAASNDVIYEWNPGTNEVTWYGDVGAVLGYGPGEFDRTLAGWENSIHPEDHEHVMTAIERHLQNPNEPFSEEYRIRNKDGSYRYWADRGMVVAAGEQKEKKWIGACTDITDKKLIETQLLQSQKMEAVGQLTGGVAHDFNNRLTAVIGNLELLERRFKDDPAALRLIRAALAAAEGGADLTRSLLSFSRKQVLEIQVFNVNDLIRSMHDLLQRALGELIKIEVTPAADLWQVRTDRGMLENVLLNLAINARDAMPGGGQLIIETANCTLDLDYIARHTHVNAGEYVVVAVSDNGIGMSEEVQRHAFEPFFTTKERGKGTGLGLSMAYGFAKQSGGNIEIYSEVGHGTSIKIYLPRLESDIPVEKAALQAATATETGSLYGQKIMVVEDDPAVLSITTAALIEMGCRVIAAESGPAALECFARDPDIALLFTDVVMPGGMTGVELAQKLRVQRPGLKVLYTSGYAPQAAASHISKTENDFWLAKPYRSHALREAVRRALQVEDSQ